MAGAPPVVPVNFNEAQKRIPEEQAQARYAPGDPNAQAVADAAAGGGGRGAPPPAPEGHLSAQQVNQRIAQFLRDNPPALRLVAQGGGRIPGVIVAQNGAGQIYDDTTPQSPAVILRNDDYGRIFRIIADGTPVSVEFNVQNQYFPEGKTSYVTVGEIPGTDKADEVVMLGGHLDSWTSATGATDNAIGCAIMMEAARILEAIGAKPRRTIRVALWSGEEEGLLGSFDYVKRHFGSAEVAAARLSPSSTPTGTSTTAPGWYAARRSSVRPTAAAVARAVSSSRSRSGASTAPIASTRARRRRQRQRRVRRRRAARHRRAAGSDRIQQHDVAHQSRHLRAHRPRRRDEERGDHGLGRAAAWPIATRCCRASPPARCRRFRPARGGAGRGNADAPARVARLPRRQGQDADRRRAGSAAARAAQADAAAPARTLAIDTAPAHGKVTLKPDGGFVYTPDKGFTGTDTFTFHITAARQTLPGTATIVVR